jgi:glycogen debranching enzyme
MVDLAALRFRLDPDEQESVPAAGLPWFMALFGRDSIITSYQALPFAPELARITLRQLAKRQGRELDDFREEEPGKILRELRFGELTAFGERPHSPYFGAHDTTPPFLVLLDETERWTGDHELIREMEPAARAALEWIEPTVTATATATWSTNAPATRGWRTSAGRTRGTRSCSPTVPSPAPHERRARFRATSTTPSDEWRDWPVRCGTTTNSRSAWRLKPRT